MLETGTAAMLLTFNIAPEARFEHDDWHTHEHVPERLAIPGFMHASRWIARSGNLPYFVMYEVQSLSVLGSAAYIERLNHPTPWTSKIMRSYMGMQRALCEVEASSGPGMGGTALLIRFDPDQGRDAELRGWLQRGVLAGLARRPGLVSTHFFAASLAAPMTREQQIRGQDAGFHYAVLVTGYDARVTAALATNELSSQCFAAHGGRVADDGCGVYHHAFSLSSAERSRA